MALADIDVDSLGDLLGRIVPPVVTEMANEEAPLWSTPYIPKVQAGKSGYVIRFKAGENGSTSMLADAGTLPSRADVVPKEVTIRPKFIVSRGHVPRGAASIGLGREDAINLLMEEAMSMGQSLGRQAELQVVYGGNILHTLVAADVTDINTNLATATAAAPVILDVTLDDIGAFRVGMKLDLHDTSAAGVLIRRLIVSKVTVDANTPAGSVGVYDSGEVTGAYTADNTDVIYAHGAKANGTTSLADVCADADLYGHDKDIDEWSANLFTGIGPLASTDLRNIQVQLSKRRGNGGFTDVLMDSLNARRYYETEEGDRRYEAMQKVDVGGKEQVQTVMGRPLRLCETVRSADIFAYHKSDLNIVIWKDFIHDGDGAVAQDKGANYVKLSDTTFSYTFEMWGAFNLAARRRNGCLRLTGITG